MKHMYILIILKMLRGGKGIGDLYLLTLNKIPRLNEFISEGMVQ